MRRILCGPKDNKSIDLYLSEALHDQDVRYFSDQNADWNLTDQPPTWTDLQAYFGTMWQPDILLAVDPEKRGMPGDFETWPVATLALTSALTPSPLWFKAVTTLFDYWIATSPQQQQMLQNWGIPTTTTLWMGYSPQYHFADPLIDRLYPLAYFNGDHYSAWIPEYEKSGRAIQYFIGIEEARNAFFLNQCQCVILDTPFITARHFEAIATGCLLLCPEDTRDMQRYLTPYEHFIPFRSDNLAELLTYWSQHPAAQQQVIHQAQQAIRPYEYGLLWQQLLAEIRSPQTAKPVQSQAKLIYHSQCSDPKGWVWASQCLQQQPRHDPEYLNHLAFLYARSAENKAIVNASEALQEMALSIFKSAAAQGHSIATINWLLLLWRWGHFESLLKHLNEWPITACPWLVPGELLLPLPPVFQELAPMGHPLESLWPLIPNWLEVECLVALNRADERCQAWYDTLAKSLPHPSFLRSSARLLKQQHQWPQAQEKYEQLLERFPLEIQAWAEYLHLKQLIPTQHFAKGATTAWLSRQVAALPNLEMFHYLQLPALVDRTTSPPHCLWEGAFFAHHSMAQINRALLRELLAHTPWEFTALPFEPPEFAPDWPECPTAFKGIPAQVLISHHWPPRWHPPQEGYWVNIVPWEYGVVPAAWIPTINQQVDEMWVPSAFVRDSFIRSGAAPEKIVVVPNGVNTQVFNPDGPAYPLVTNKTFRFLFVGGSLKRKGVDLLLEAYGKAFGPADDVCLIIKDFGTRGLYMNLSYRSEIEAFMAQPEHPEVLYLQDLDLADTDMAALYRSCQVYVHPYRGEGFGMPILEALACGRPVMVPNAGPAPEFCPPAATTWIPTWVQFEDSRDVGGVGLADYQPFWNEPDVDALSQLLRQAYLHPEKLVAQGIAARKHALHYDWQQIALQVQQRLDRLHQQPAPYRLRQGQAQQQIAQSLQYFQQQQWEDFGQCLQSALQLAPSSPLLWHYQSVFALNQNHLPEAHGALHQALKYGLNWNDARITLAAFKQAQDKQPLPPLPVSYSWYSEVVSETPASPEAPDWFCQPQHAQVAIRSTVVWPPPNQEGIWRLLTRPGKPLVPTDGVVWLPDTDLMPENPPQNWAYLPLMVDFRIFNPHVIPLVLEESQGCQVFLSVVDWRCDDGWQTLLAGYIQAFSEHSKVNLLFKPLGIDCETAVADISAWLEQQGYDLERIPALTILQEDIHPDVWPQLIAGANCFVGVNTHGHGWWHLAALATGIPVISTGQWSFLKNPYSQTILPGDSSHLAWLMQHIQARRQSNHSRAIREYLQPQHDLATAWPRIQVLLERAYLMRLLEMDR